MDDLETVEFCSEVDVYWVIEEEEQVKKTIEIFVNLIEIDLGKRGYSDDGLGRGFKGRVKCYTSIII